MELKWLQRQRTELLYFKTRRFLPTAAIGALIGAFLLVFLNLAILLTLDGREVWPENGIYHVVQPASCLSVLLSLTSLLIEFALGEGVVYVWWYNYAQGADVKTLQKLWLIGDWTPNAALNLLDPTHRRYLAIPVLFATVLPWNGFILQGAILTEPVYVTEPTTIQVPMAPYVEYRFSRGGPNSTAWASGFGWMWQQVMDPAGTKMSKYAYFGSRTVSTNETIDLGYNDASIYTANVPGAGFDYNCSHPDLTYDMFPTAERQNTSGLIFSSTFDWSPERPNDIELFVYWKEDRGCIGRYQTTRCTLRAATVEYPIRVQMNVSENPYRGPFYTLQRSKYGVPDKVLSILPVDSREGQGNNWTYSGIRNALASDFGSTFEVRDVYNQPESGSVNITGRFSQIIQPGGPFNAYFCNWTYVNGLSAIDHARYLDSETINENVEKGLWPVNHAEPSSPAYIILDQLRQAMFLSSVMIGSQAVTDLWTGAFYSNLSNPREYFVPTVPAMETKLVNRYKTRVDVWGVSVAITWTMVLLIVPTFWSFWRLPYRKDLSPLEIARAFNAPMFNQINEAEPASEVLQRVGHEKLQIEPLLSEGTDGAPLSP